MYDALGYLEEPISRSASGIDIDSFDTKAIHFAAVDHRSHAFVGTARLVTTVPQRIGQTIIGDPWRVIQDHAEWVKAIVRQALLKEDRIFHEKIHQSTELPFPILFNSDFGTKYRAFMEEHPPASGGEISRVVVSPLHRGLGVSALLMRAVISAAFHLKKKFLLLECVPAHAENVREIWFSIDRRPPLPSPRTGSGGGRHAAGSRRPSFQQSGCPRKIRRANARRVGAPLLVSQRRVLEAARV